MHTALGVACAMIGGVAGWIGFADSRAGAYEASLGSYQYVVLPDGNDRIVNYDHVVSQVNRYFADWPLNLVFTGSAQGAEVDNIKDILAPQFKRSGRKMYAYFRDGYYMQWDLDSGVKNPPPGVSCPINIRMRLYADHDDQLYSTHYGYYVMASSHYDWNEHCAGAWFGDSESAEYWFTQEFAVRGYSYYPEELWVKNHEVARWEGNHFWASTGNWSRIIVI